MTVPLPEKNSCDEEEDRESELPPPPDGGWGWAVVFGSFMIHIITDGVTYSFGVFYDEFLGYFNEGKGATAWILSILVGITLCSGPISSAFVNRWGCRAVTIAGAILGSICMIISSFAQNVTTLYFTIGIGTGLGFGLIYLPAIVSVTTYFEKKRSLATGIAVCGSGLGTFIFAPLINLLLQEFGWRGAMLIVSALVLECIIFGALFRPLEYDVKPVKTDIEVRVTAPETNMSVSQDHIDVYNNIDSRNTSDLKRPKSMTLIKSQKNGSTCYKLSRSQPVLNSTQYEPIGHQYANQHLKRSRNVLRQDTFYQYSIPDFGIFKSKLDVKDATEVEKIIRRPSMHSRHQQEDTNTTVCGFIPCSGETKATLFEMLNLSLLKDPIFILFTFSNFCTSIGFNIPYVYIVSKAKSLNISAENASILLSVIGVANTIGRIVLGYISDNPKINRLFVYNMCLTICGVATAFSAFCDDFYTLALYGTIFGFTIGAYVGLTSVILVDLLGLEKLTNAFGLLLLFQGIASLIGPPIAGELYDSLASYNPGFYVSGITIAISGIILFAIPPLQRWQARKSNLVEPRNGNA